MSQNLTKLINQVSSTLIICQCGLSLHLRQGRGLCQKWAVKTKTPLDPRASSFYYRMMTINRNN